MRIGIPHDGDHPFGSILDKGNGKCIITRQDDKVLGEFARSNLRCLLRIARSLLNTNNIIKVTCQAHGRIGSHIHPDTPWDIVEHQRKGAFGSQVGKVAIHSFLRRLVVVRYDREHPRETSRIQLTKTLTGLTGIISPETDHQRTATCHLLDDMLRDTLTLLTGKARGFTCRPVDDDEVRSPIAEQMFEEAFQTLIVDLLFFGEGGNECYPHPAEGMLTHSFSLYDEYVGKGNPFTQS